jgi:hypothetical protein
VKPEKPDPYGPPKYGPLGQVPVREIDRKMVETVAWYTKHFVSLDLTGLVDSLHDLLVRAEKAHREALEDWLRRYSREGSEHRVYRLLIKNMELPEKIDFDPDYDDYESLKRGWLKDIAEAQKKWEEDWQKDFGRPHKKSNPRKFHDGSGLAVPPLIAIYVLVNEWFVDDVELEFWPQFADDGDPANEAAGLFCAVAEILDHNYTPLRCKRVHDKNYGKLTIRY